MKKITIFSLSLAYAYGLLAAPALAKNDDGSSNAMGIPEKNGTYDVPGQPGLKVKVFVYRPKADSRPEPAPSPDVRPVCSNVDPGSSAPVDPTGWKLPTSWTYNLNVSTVPASVGRANLETLTDLSFGEWYKNLPDGMTISRSDNTNLYKAKYDHKNIISWGSASGTALAVTYTWALNGTVVENDTIMNKKFAWSWNTCTAGTYDAQNILTHELGHWMGLDDHYTSAYADNTMYGYGSKGEIKKDTLTAGDISGLNAIYN